MSPLAVRTSPALATACLCSLIPIMMLLSSCGGRTELREQDEGYSMTTTLSLDRAEGLVESGRQARMEGRYAEAERAFRAVYENQSAAADLRANALFELAQVYALLDNPHKDPARARESLTQLLAEFPNSPLRERAARRLEQLRALDRDEGTD